MLETILILILAALICVGIAGGQRFLIILRRRQARALGRRILLRVMGHISEIDGGLPESDFVQLFGSDQHGDGRDFRAGMQEDFDLDATLDLAEPIPELHESLIRSWCLAACDGEGLTPEKRRVLEYCCDRLDVPRTFMHKICDECMED